MDNTNKLSTRELKMQSLLEAFLLSRKSLKSSAAETSFHIDEDSLTAFTEGNISERESMPVISHLASCGFCRHKTAELVRLDLAFRSDEEDVRTAPAAEPHKISDVLSGLLTKIFGTPDGAVFAHNEKDSDDKNQKNAANSTA
ncbi:MAG: hypothetical protein ABI481_05820, partial [Pyrinomonadaceae bacterium]